MTFLSFQHTLFSFLLFSIILPFQFSHTVIFFISFFSFFLFFLFVSTDVPSTTQCRALLKIHSDLNPKTQQQNLYSEIMDPEIASLSTSCTATSPPHSAFEPPSPSPSSHLSSPPTPSALPFTPSPPSSFPPSSTLLGPPFRNPTTSQSPLHPRINTHSLIPTPSVPYLKCVTILDEAFLLDTYNVLGANGQRVSAQLNR